MQTTVIHAGRILTPDEEINDAIILVEGSRIAAIGRSVSSSVWKPCRARTSDFAR